MDNKILKIIPLSLGVLALSLFIAYLLHATWTEPPGAPPAGNPVLADRLYVYKNDGATRLGVFFRRKIGDRDMGFHCNWGFAPFTGGVRWLSDFDRVAFGELPCFRVYYTGDRCTGRRFVPGRSHKRLAYSDCTTPHTHARVYPDRIIAIEEASQTLMTRSRRECNGLCRDVSDGNRRVFSFQFLNLSMGLCGAGPCIIK